MFWDANVVVCECCEKIVPDDEYYVSETGEIVCPNCWERMAL